MRIDLHTHSNISDGTDMPRVVVQKATQAGLDVVALTDHDSTEGTAEAIRAGQEFRIVVLAGLEVSCRGPAGEAIHMLSYCHDMRHSGLQERLQHSRHMRRTRFHAMAHSVLREYPEVQPYLEGSIRDTSALGRPHLADALIKARIVGSREEAFASVMNVEGHHWLPYDAPHPVDAVELIRQAGGVPVLAHPLARGFPFDQKLFQQMLEAGLAGLEVGHREHNESDTTLLRALAHRHGLIMTGSSDYHGAGKPNQLGEFLTSVEALHRIEGEGVGGDPSLRGSDEEAR